ncbi:hypothetical protein ACG873_31210 [Mesorhizobium sp. AaZ16]|uniref:hypothetical protein n=1 Tax=Mesorhizobium sp. AaZ16 TaxID=3402289 RepID=UPI00374F8023
MNIRPTLAGLALSILMLPAAIAQPTNYPLTVENCGRILTFEAAPQKVVSLGQAIHEIYALNLGPRITGTAVCLSL